MGVKTCASVSSHTPTITLPCLLLSWKKTTPVTSIPHGSRAGMDIHKDKLLYTVSHCSLFSVGGDLLT